MPKEKKPGLKLVKDSKESKDKKGAKAGKPVDAKKKTTKDRTFDIDASVKVKIDKDCGLSEPARMVIERHAARLLERLLKKDARAFVEDNYMRAVPTRVRIKDWALLDLRPDKADDDRQEELPTNEKE